MNLVEAGTILLAGVGAGTINTVVGSGSLITFPTLLAFGYPPVSANISNNFGLVPGGISGTWGYRRELGGTSAALKRLVPASLLGGLAGALLLLALPESAFAAIVPLLIAIALVLVVVQPKLSARVAATRAKAATSGGTQRGHAVALGSGVFGTGVYGGYFGAAQGVLLLGLLGVLLTEPIQRINAIKNVLATVVNAMAAVTFAVVAWDQINWATAGLIAVGSTVGGQVGAGVGRRLSPAALRACIVVIGSIAIIVLLRP